MPFFSSDAGSARSRTNRRFSTDAVLDEAAPSGKSTAIVAGSPPITTVTSAASVDGPFLRREPTILRDGATEAMHSFDFLFSLAIVGAWVGGVIGGLGGYIATPSVSECLRGAALYAVAGGLIGAVVLMGVGIVGNLVSWIVNPTE